jgi:hypothetical protein
MAVHPAMARIVEKLMDADLSAQDAILDDR